MGDDRPSRHIETDSDGNETVVYRASSLGSCTRIFVAHARGHEPAPPPAWLQEIFDEGHAFEPLIRERFEKEQHCKVVDDQLELELDLGVMHGRRVIVRGHIDGIVTNTLDEERELFEAKKIRESGWHDMLRKGIEYNVNYPWQLSVYMIGLELDTAQFVAGRVIDGELAELHTIEVQGPPFNLLAIRKRIKSIEDLIATGFDATEVPCTKNTFPCPFFKLHDEPDEPVAFALPVDGEQGEVVKLLLEEYAAATALAAETSKAQRAANDTKKRVAAGLYAWIEQAGPEAQAAELLTGHGFALTRKRSTVAAHMVKESQRDTLTVKQTQTETETP